MGKGEEEIRGGQRRKGKREVQRRPLQELELAQIMFVHRYNIMHFS